MDTGAPEQSCTDLRFSLPSLAGECAGQQKFNRRRHLPLDFHLRLWQKEAMNRTELIHELAEANDISFDLARMFVDTTISMMKQQLIEGGRVEIRGLGSFTMREYSGYKGRNPRTGESVKVKPKRIPYFRCGLDLKQMVNE